VGEKKVNASLKMFSIHGIYSSFIEKYIQINLFFEDFLSDLNVLNCENFV